ncbi:MAG: T9SS type A sorting domain-containing protein [Bacteroidetes bacterium]|nr:T9SS type A sorting domain-containing protein [Bacteroidota bacterium]
MRQTNTFILIFGFILLIISNAQAGIIQSASCQKDSIQSAIDRAEAGDTILVPPGECIWDDQLLITKGIILLGSGIDTTIIKYNGPSGYTYAVNVSPDLETAQNDHAVRISGFTFEKLVRAYATIILQNNHYEYPLTKVMIDHNKFINLNSGETEFAIQLYLAMFGVVHNNIIQNGSSAWRYMGGLGNGRLVEYWIPGSTNAMYFEDNFIHTTTEKEMAVTSGGNGNRFVSRYNTFDFSSRGSTACVQLYDIHGNQPNNNGAGIGFEVYGNRVIGTNGRWFDLRAGKIFYFSNQWSGSYRKGYYYVWEEYNDDVFSIYSCEGTSYPKTAAGNCVQRPYGSYFWKNYGGANGDELSTDCVINFDHYNREYTRNDTVIEAVINNPPLIFENQNWWRDNTAAFDGTIDPIGTCGCYGGEECTKSGIGYGTLAQMDAITPMVEGLGFWATDQELDLAGMTGQNPSNPIRGTLYRSVDDGIGGYKWEAYYTPLGYPHPLRTSNPTSVKKQSVENPSNYKLHQNYPNPFNPNTVISYLLKVRSEVKLVIYDILGREVITLVNGQKPAGTYTVQWDGTNSAGQQVVSGIYFYRLKTGGGFVSANKMLMLK